MLHSQCVAMFISGIQANHTHCPFTSCLQFASMGILKLIYPLHDEKLDTNQFCWVSLGCFIGERLEKLHNDHLITVSRGRSLHFDVYGWQWR